MTWIVYRHVDTIAASAEAVVVVVMVVVVFVVVVVVVVVVLVAVGAVVCSYHAVITCRMGACSRHVCDCPPLQLQPVLVCPADPQHVHLQSLILGLIMRQQLMN